MHIKRWITGLISLPILIYLIGPGPRPLLYVFIFSAALIGILEFNKITSIRLPKTVIMLNIFLTLFLFILFYFRQILFIPIMIVLYAFVPMIFSMLSYPKNVERLNADIGTSLLGPVYIGLPLCMVVMIDMLPKGNLWIFFLLTITFANDTGAFYFGKSLGKHKLYREVSPNKTWEGAIGGLISSLFIAIIFLRIFPIHNLNLCILILVLTMSVASQTGDLVESMLKRVHGVKDSGYLLPGHGGVLDRIDGLLFSIPVLYVYLTWTI